MRFVSTPLLFAAVALTTVATCRAGEALHLVTPEEYTRERYSATDPSAGGAEVPPDFFPKIVIPKSEGAPVISVIRPDYSVPLLSPFPIQLVFEAGAGATIRPETFRIRYGRLRIDITERVLRHTKVVQSGLRVDEATVPSGQHLLRMSVDDDRGRTGETLLEFVVK